MSSDDDIAQDLASDATLDTCHCCDVPTDAPIFNRPGLAALAYRAGTYATFFERMKTLLPLATSPTTGDRPLAALTTRNLDDPTIALLDAAAIVGDILTFYQERIANEGFLRTATERRSVLELAREIGYELNPGVAASTVLAFTIDKALAPIPGMPMPEIVPLPSGLKVQSVPGPNQMPQMFETTAPLSARVAWNAMVARTTQRQELAIDTATGVVFRVDPHTGVKHVADSIWFDGTQTNLRIGDLLWIEVASTWAYDPVSSLETGIACVFVASVDPDYTLKRTRVGLSQSSAVAQPPYFNPAQPGGVVSLTPMPLDLGTVAALVVYRDWNDADLRAYMAIQKWDEDALLDLVTQVLELEPAAADVYALRTKTGMFGNQAPRWAQIDNAWQSSGSIGTEPWPNSWDGNQSIFAGSGQWWWDRYTVDVLLDRVQPLAVGSLVAFASTQVTPPVPLKITGVQDLSAVDFAISSRVTGLTLEAPWTNWYGNLWQAYMRETTAYVQSEPLALTDAPILAPVGILEAHATELMLDRMILGLDPDQQIVLTGTIAYGTVSSGHTASEVVEIANVTHSRGYTTLYFKTALQHPYVRASIAINANVAPATHGETTTDEILGSGDASQKNQTFQLAKPPLTYVSAPTASGGQDTLTVRVNGLAWQEVPTLYGCAPTDTVYTVRLADDGTTTIRFGDGVVGARLPTGANNITATYRSGLGPAGNLGPQAISLLNTRPFGLKNGLNPLPATGGAAPERLANARQNAPRTVRTLDRIVSLDDYTDFARGFAGVAKALAVPLWSGESEVVHVTVAGIGGAWIDPQGSPWSNLVAGILDASPGLQAIRVSNYLPAYFYLSAKIVVDPARELDVVMAEVTHALRRELSFAARDLAQTMTEAEAIMVAQNVVGVIAVEITQLYRAGNPPAIAGTLPASGAHYAGGAIVPAELLLLHPVGLSLTGVNP
jgi:predicted phage baseplate assembly protein